MISPFLQALGFHGGQETIRVGRELAVRLRLKIAANPMAHDDADAGSGNPGPCRQVWDFQPPIP